VEIGVIKARQARSFFEKKEPKKLLPPGVRVGLRLGLRNTRGAGGQKFFASFFKKDGACLP
jgi:hypothetical protein